MDILKRILFCLVILGLIGGEVLRFDTGHAVAVTFLDITVGGWVIVSIILGIWQKKFLQLNYFKQYLFWFVVIGSVSLLLQIPNLTTQQFTTSFLYLLRFIFYTLGILWSVELLDKKFRKNLPYILFSSATIISLLGFVQYLLYPSLRNLYYAGWDVHLYRLFATFLDPNFVGLFFVLGIILGMGLFVQVKNTKHKILIGIGEALLIVALFLTYSRDSYIAAIVGIGIFLWRQGAKKFIFAVIGVVFVGIVLLQLFSPHSEGTKLLRTASITGRFDGIKQAVTIAVHHPFLGVGFDAYRYAQQKEGFIVSDTTHAGAGTDNSFLFVAATTGITGLIAYVLMTYQVLKMSFITKSLVGKIVFPSYIALIVGSFFVNALFYPFILSWIVLLLGVI